MEDLHVAEWGGEVCGRFALPQVHKAVAHRSKTIAVCVCSGKEVQFWGWFSLCLEAELIKTWGQSASDLENCVLNSHFHLTGIWKHKQSHSAISQLFSSANPGPASAKGAPLDLHQPKMWPTLSIASGIHMWTSFGQAHQPSLFPDVYTTCGLENGWRQPPPSNPSGHQPHELFACINSTNDPIPAPFIWIRSLPYWFFSNADQIKKMPGMAFAKSEPDSHISVK